MTKADKKKPIYAKVVITGKMLAVTGLHIGSQQAGLDIGGLDLPVVRDPITRFPYVPGSSLKGKMRALTERRLNKEFNRGHRDIFRHECDSADPSCPVCRLFGSTGQGDNGNNFPARLIVRDLPITEDSKKHLERVQTGLRYTEWKFENTLDRVTSAAMPRQVERVPAGTEFEFEVVYTAETDDREQLTQDLANTLAALEMVQDDTLGGHGSRGYGKVAFSLTAVTVRPRTYYEGQGEEKPVPVTSIAECRNKLEKIVGLLTQAAASSPTAPEGQAHDSSG